MKKLVFLEELKRNEITWQFGVSDECLATNQILTLTECQCYLTFESCWSFTMSCWKKCSRYFLIVNKVLKQKLTNTAGHNNKKGQRLDNVDSWHQDVSKLTRNKHLLSWLMFVFAITGQGGRRAACVWSWCSNRHQADGGSQQAESACRSRVALCTADDVLLRIITQFSWIWPWVQEEVGIENGWMDVAFFEF